MNKDIIEQHFPRLKQQSDEPTPEARSAQMKQQVDEFIRQGGAVQIIPNNLTTLDECGRTTEERQKQHERGLRAAKMGAIAKNEILRQQQLSAAR